MQIVHGEGRQYKQSAYWSIPLHFSLTYVNRPQRLSLAKVMVTHVNIFEKLARRVTGGGGICVEVDVGCNTVLIN